MTLQRSPHPTTSQSRPPTPEPNRKGWRLAWLALLPAACCGLPLLLTAVAAFGTGVTVGGGFGLAVVVVTGGVIIVTFRRRRGACPPAPVSTKPGHQ